MYQITIEINGIKLQKEADTIDEVHKIVYAYVNGEQKRLRTNRKDIINKPKITKRWEQYKPNCVTSLPNFGAINDCDITAMLASAR